MHESPHDTGPGARFPLPGLPRHSTAAGIVLHDYVGNVKARDVGRPMNNYWSAHPPGCSA